MKQKENSSKLLEKYKQKWDLYNKAQTLKKQKLSKSQDFGKEIELADSRAKKLKQELDANPISEKDPNYKEYKGYVDLVNSVIQKAKQAQTEFEKIHNKLKSIDLELSSNKDKVLTTNDLERIIKQL